MAGLQFSMMEKAVLAGLIGSGSLLRLSMPSSVPTLPFGRLDMLLTSSEQKQWSITVVNMEYARVSTTEGGELLPSVNYHVLLGRSPGETVRYAQKISEHMCGEEGFELHFEEKSILGEAFTNGCSLLKTVPAVSSQFIAQKYATFA
jgi:hypothetical protein